MMGGNDFGIAAGPWYETRSLPPHNTYWKNSQLVGRVDKTFVFDEEAETSLDDGEFGVYPLTSPMVNTWWNMAANYHNNGANFSFDDGHCEYFKWHGAVVAASQNIASPNALGQNGDVAGDGGANILPLQMIYPGLRPPPATIRCINKHTTAAGTGLLTLPALPILPWMEAGGAQYLDSGTG